MQAKLNKRQGNYHSELTEDKVKAILCDIFDNHAPVKFACEANFIDESTFYKWLAQGRVDMKHNLDTPESQLVKSYSRKTIERIGMYVDKIVDAKKGHFGAQWYLARAHWRHFSDKVEALELSEMIEKERMERDLQIQGEKHHVPTRKGKKETKKG